ncbi:hypothetical protein NliqN6_5132 [Naganishia liquefaciens]|uniref:Transmembrane protein n=1 Tax=Naganishia liquefaciens TaxID=104408 RepID=A0A8H3TWX8_9TREE|nr:hypothetical protein NliqN6_5132 [Naganishia liquefaciens]
MSPAPPSLPPSPDASATSPASTQSTSTSSNPKLPEHDASRPRTPQEAERFFRRIALENQPPSRTMRWLSIGGWVAGAFAAGYMVLYADFGDREHVFSPIRRQFGTYTRSLTSLSEQEKAQLGVSSRSVFENHRREPTLRETLESEGEKGLPR